MQEYWFLYDTKLVILVWLKNGERFLFGSIINVQQEVTAQFLNLMVNFLFYKISCHGSNGKSATNQMPMVIARGEDIFCLFVDTGLVHFFDLVYSIILSQCIC